MICLQALLFVALFTVALAHRSECFYTSVSNTLRTTMIRIVKKFSYSGSCRKFSNLVSGRGLMLLLLLGGDVSFNPGPLTLGVVNTRSIRNKGPIIANIVASNDLDILCLTEAHVCPYDSDSFLQSITPADYIFPHRPCSSGIGSGVGFFIRSSYSLHTMESPFYQSFKNMVVSLGLHGHSLLLACVYCPPGSCTCKFQEEFMSFVSYLSSIN